MDDVERVKQKLDIVDVIGQYIPLKKTGRNFKCPCPFHGEKTPSFVVSPERQIYHCFGCGKGGDIFTFIQEYENVGFGEALKELAARAGVKIEKPAFATEKEKKQDLIYSLNHLTSQFYSYLLLEHPAGKRALKYLTDERKLTIPLIKTFQLGFAPGNDALVKYLIGKKRYKEEDLLLAGLAFQKGRYVSDFFRDRIMFPIIDHRNNVVAFSGRQLSADSYGGKYVNTKETPVYIKGDTVFGLNLAKEGIKKEGKVIIVEGEFDVITAHKEGIPNIVAVKGTALTDNQIKLLKRFTQKFVFCFDTDMAGTEAQRRSIQLIENEGITATVIIPPAGKDPDELLNENPILFKKAAKNDVNVYDFLITSASNQFDAETVDGKKNILDKTLPYLIAIENEVIREHYYKKLAEALDTSLDSIQKQADKSKRPEVKVQPVATKSQLPREEVLEIFLLSLVFQSKNPKQAASQVRTTLNQIPLSTPSLEKVLKHLENFSQTSIEFSPEEFARALPAELHVPFDTAYLSPIPDFRDDSSYNNELQKCARQVRSVAVRNRLKTLGEDIKRAESEKDEEKIKKYEEEFSTLSQLLGSN